MLVVDSSAILAMLFDEPDGMRCAAAIAEASRRIISAVNYVEAGTVLMARTRAPDRRSAIDDLDAFLTQFAITIAPVTAWPEFR